MILIMIDFDMGTYMNAHADHAPMSIGTRHMVHMY